jgi:hypothetical protein
MMRHPVKNAQYYWIIDTCGRKLCVVVRRSIDFSEIRPGGEYLPGMGTGDGKWELVRGYFTLLWFERLFSPGS